MTALVANEIISLDKKVSVPEGVLSNPPVADDTTPKTFLVDTLFYPLLMQSSNGVADALASYYGTGGFIGWMNSTARALSMTSTIFSDASGAQAANTSTAEDLFRLAAYLSEKKSFVFDITSTQNKTITAEDGTSYTIRNVNAPGDASPFIGGKVGHTTAAHDTGVSILSLDAGGQTRHVAIIILGSNDQSQDTTRLASWLVARVQTAAQSACVSCTLQHYRKIEL
jgi:D-alanyl-D-alanine carboxypeptidase